jgi:hypothetical protein
LVAKRAEEERLEHAARNRPRENVKKLTEEEKAERVRQMESDAGANDDKRLQRLKGLTSTSNILDKKEEQLAEGEASFLKSMRSEVYISDGTTMGERLQQNKHYTQKGTELDSSGFMKK